MNIHGSLNDFALHASNLVVRVGGQDTTAEGYIEHRATNKQRNSDRAVVCEYFVASLSMFYIKLILFPPSSCTTHRDANPGGGEQL